LKAAAPLSMANPRIVETNKKLKDSAVQIKDSVAQMERSTARVEDSADRGLPRGDQGARTLWEMRNDLIGWMALLLLVALVIWRHWP
jgi:hypothetical protein